jgi:hypothetical protein
MLAQSAWLLWFETLVPALIRYSLFFPKPKTALLLLLLLLSVSNIWARQCFEAVVTPDERQQKVSVRIEVDSQDHPDLKSQSRRCDHYWSYFAGNLVDEGGAVLSRNDCLKDPTALRLSKGYAPLGVFMRSSVENPGAKVTAYDWEIRGVSGGAESLGVVARYDSFNAGFVFERPGEYEAVLRVSFSDGSHSVARQSIDVWSRDKTTYYVDAEVGDDRFDGKSITPDKNCLPASNPVATCAGPWKTATRALSNFSPRAWQGKPGSRYLAEAACISAKRTLVFRHPNGDHVLASEVDKPDFSAKLSRPGSHLLPYEAAVCERLAAPLSSPYKPGDQVLFKRGQIFEFEAGLLVQDQEANTDRLTCASLVSPGHWAAPNGVLFGAFGQGGKPLIQRAGGAACMAFNLASVGLMHLTFQDLIFDMGQAKGLPDAPRSSFMFAVGHPIGLVFNRVSLRNFDQGIMFHNAKGFFLQDSRFHDSRVVHLYSETASDVFMAGNHFDYSGNHISYTNMGNALITKNTFSRPAFGRTALRVFGTSQQAPTRSIWVSDNIFEGWVDPRTAASCDVPGRCPFADGKRFNYSLVEFQPNTMEGDKFLDRIVFVRNYLGKAENLMRFAGVDGLLVQSNVFDAAGDASGTPRVMLTDAAKRPSRDVLIDNNVFVDTARPDGSEPSSQVAVFDYSQLPCEDQATHSRIRISDNQFWSPFEKLCALKHINKSTGSTQCLLLSDDDASVASPNGLAHQGNVFRLLDSGAGGNLRKQIDAVGAVLRGRPVQFH